MKTKIINTFNPRKLKLAQVDKDSAVLTDRSYNICGYFEKKEGVATIYFYDGISQKIENIFYNTGIYGILNLLVKLNIENMEPTNFFHLDYSHNDIKMKKVVVSTTKLMEKINNLGLEELIMRRN